MKLHTPLGDPTNLALAGSNDRSGKGMYFIFLLLPLCCGLPLMVIVLATASALTKGLVVGVMVALVGTVVALLVRRRMRTNAACCVPPRATVPSPDFREVDHRP